MKKTTTILIALSLCGIAYAQGGFSPAPADTLFGKEVPYGNVSWGLKAGWNYANLYGSEIGDVFANGRTAFRSGFHAGITVDARLSGRFGLRHELLFSQKRTGIALADADGSADYRSALAMAYIDLMPVGLRFRAGRFQLCAGPYVGTLLGASIRRRDENGRFFRDKSIFGSPENDESESRYLQKFDFGAAFGLTYRFAPRLSVGIRYAHGLADIFQNANGAAKTDRIGVYNRGWLFSFEYL